MDKLEMRTIKDINGNIYDIFEVLYLDRHGRWRSLAIYETYEDAAKFHRFEVVVDKRVGTDFIP